DLTWRGARFGGQAGGATLYEKDLFPPSLVAFGEFAAFGRDPWPMRLGRGGRKGSHRVAPRLRRLRRAGSRRTRERARRLRLPACAAESSRAVRVEIRPSPASPRGAGSPRATWDRCNDP